MTDDRCYILTCLKADGKTEDRLARGKTEMQRLVNDFDVVEMHRVVRTQNPFGSTWERVTYF